MDSSKLISGLREASKLIKEAAESIEVDLNKTASTGDLSVDAEVFTQVRLAEYLDAVGKGVLGNVQS